jgi:hypothetical protein
MYGLAGRLPSAQRSAVKQRPHQETRWLSRVESFVERLGFASDSQRSAQRPAAMITDAPKASVKTKAAGANHQRTNEFRASASSATPREARRLAPMAW